MDDKHKATAKQWLTPGMLTLEGAPDTTPEDFTTAWPELIPIRLLEYLDALAAPGTPPWTSGKITVSRITYSSGIKLSERVEKTATLSGDLVAVTASTVTTVALKDVSDSDKAPVKITRTVRPLTNAVRLTVTHEIPKHEPGTTDDVHLTAVISFRPNDTVPLSATGEDQARKLLAILAPLDFR